MGRLLASPRWGARPETLGRSGLSLGPDALAVIDQADRKRKSFKRYLDDTRTCKEVERKKTIIHIHKNNRYICNKILKQHTEIIIKKVALHCGLLQNNEFSRSNKYRSVVKLACTSS